MVFWFALELARSAACGGKEVALLAVGIGVLNGDPNLHASVARFGYVAFGCRYFEANAPASACPLVSEHKSCDCEAVLCAACANRS